MTVQQYKSVFEKIAIAVVGHDTAKTKGQFFMFDEEDFVSVSKVFLDLNKMCIEVGYPIDTTIIEDGKQYTQTVFVFNISRIVAIDNFDDQLLAIQEALIVGEKFVKYLFWLQQKYNGFGVMAGSQTKFDYAKFDFKPLVSSENDNTSGRQMTLVFRTPFDFCDAVIEADVASWV
jgi:hypothetical protein